MEKIVQPYRYPVVRPYASRRNTYSPPAFGIIAASSAYVSAPATARSPDTIQTAITVSGEPTLQVITRVLRNTPVPIMLAMLTEVAATSPRPRTREVESRASGIRV